jgi:lipid-A-disaccharide synthase-like uncharacterized protein
MIRPEYAALAAITDPGGLLARQLSFWNIIGWLGNAVFFSRFFVQWWATEKKGQVVVPTLFWWLSLAGSLLLLSYAVFFDKHPVFIFAYAFTWIPYIRNLMIHRRHERSHRHCAGCGAASPPSARFCSQCGCALETETRAAKAI